MNEQYKNLFSPLKIGKLTLKNRFCLAPMGADFNYYGGVNAECRDFYARIARGGFALVELASTIVDTEIDSNSSYERHSPNFNSKNFVISTAPMNDRIHSYGAKSFIQLSMGSARSTLFKGPSPLKGLFNGKVDVPALTKDEIKRKIELMIQAAERSKKAGFDGIDIHALHWGYLLDEFAMSLTNQRTDEYGGILENRLRITKEIVEGIKQVNGADYPVMMRLGLKSYIKNVGQPNRFYSGAMGVSSLDGENEAGRTLEEALEICKALESYGYDAISADVGMYESFYHACPPVYMPKGHYIPLAAEAKKVVDIPVLLSNRMNDADMAEAAIRDGKIDAVVIGRQALADPDYPNKIAKGDFDSIRPCIACNQCMGSHFKIGGNVGCAVNPSVTREVSYGMKKALEPKKVMVIGGGVAGMEAARTAKLSGHTVTLFEATDVLGGSLIPAGAHTFKKEVADLNRWYIRELTRLGIDVKMNTKVTPEMIKKSDADVAIVATGASPSMPKIPGIDHPKTVSCTDAILAKKPIGDRVVIVGAGLVGCEIAVDLAKEGKQVTIVEALPNIVSSGPVVPVMNVMMIEDLLEKYNVNVLTGHKIIEVNDKGAVIAAVNTPDELAVLAADNVIMAVGFRSAPSMRDELIGSNMDIYQVGDCNSVGSILTSIWDAYEISRAL